LVEVEQQWTDDASGRALPKFVTEALHEYLDCGILALGFAHLYCESEIDDAHAFLVSQRHSSKRS
jgi:hypothetical protein